MAMIPKPPMGKTRGQKAESKRMTAQGLSEAKARLAFIDEMKKANPGIGFKIPKKQEKELSTFVDKYGKKAGARKAAKPKTEAKKAQPPAGRKPAPKKKNGVTPLAPLFKASGKAAKAIKK